jgi:hypothetical protein
MDDDESSTTDSADDSGHSSLHSSASGPVMDGRGPEEPDWMSKFSKIGGRGGAKGSPARKSASPTKERAPSISFSRGETSADDSGHSSLHSSASGLVMDGRGPEEPDWMSKFSKIGGGGGGGGAKGSPARKSVSPTKGIAPSSSFSRGETNTPEQPEWMNKFKLIGQKSKSNQTVPTSDADDSPPDGQSLSPPRRQSEAPSAVASTPGWMKEYRKGGVTMAMAGAPSLPTGPPLAQAQPPAQAQPEPASKVSNTPAWRRSSLNNSNSNFSSFRINPAATAAPETPQWMSRFKIPGNSNGLPMAPNMNDDSSDDEQSIASVSSINTSNTATAEPEWMGRFNKVKPPQNQPTAPGAEPEWIGKFHRRPSNTATTATGDQPNHRMSSPGRKGRASASGEEPEWMTHYREIGVKDGEASSRRTKQVFRDIQRASIPAQDLRKSGGTPAPQRTLQRSLSMRMSSSMVTEFMSISNLMAPASPIAAGVGHTSSSGGMDYGMISPPPASSGQRRQSIGGSGSHNHNISIPLTPPPQPKVEDPAARAPAMPDWMNKVKAASQNSNEQPEWLKKLKQKNLGVDEPQTPIGTPPWKRKERLKAEQTRLLRVEQGLPMHYDDDDESTSDSDDYSDEEEEEGHVPEWMRQFKKMHLPKPEVFWAQGRGTQTISSLRRGSVTVAQMSGSVVDPVSPTRAVPIIMPKAKRKKKKIKYIPNQVHTGSSASATLSSDDKDPSEVSLNDSLQLIDTRCGGSTSKIFWSR